MSWLLILHRIFGFVERSSFLSRKIYFELSTLPRANRDEMRMQQNAFSNPMAAFRVVFGIPIGVKKRNVRGVAVWGGWSVLYLGSQPILLTVGE